MTTKLHSDPRLEEGAALARTLTKPWYSGRVEDYDPNVRISHPQHFTDDTALDLYEDLMRHNNRAW